MITYIRKLKLEKFEISNLWENLYFENIDYMWFDFTYWFYGQILLLWENIDFKCNFLILWVIFWFYEWIDVLREFFWFYANIEMSWRGCVINCNFVRKEKKKKKKKEKKKKKNKKKKWHSLSCGSDRAAAQVKIWKKSLQRN